VTGEFADAPVDQDALDAGRENVIDRYAKSDINADRHPAARA